MPWTTCHASSPPPLLPMHLDDRDPGHTDAVAAFFARPGARARFREIDGSLCVRLTGATFEASDPAPRREVIDARLCPHGVLMRRRRDPEDADGGSAVSDDEIGRQWRQLPDDQRDASVLMMLIVNTVVDAHHDVLDEIRVRLQRLDDALLAPHPPLNEILPQLRRLGSHLDAVRDGIIPLRPQVRELLELREPVERGLVSAAGGRWLANIERDLVVEVPASLIVAERRVAAVTESLHGERSESTNRIVALLTVVTSAFFVPTLITGLYGMNVPLPGQERHIAFWVVICLTVALVTLAVVMITKMGLWGTFRRILPTPKDLLRPIDLLPGRGRDRDAP